MDPIDRQKLIQLEKYNEKSKYWRPGKTGLCMFDPKIMFRESGMVTENIT